MGLEERALQNFFNYRALTTYLKIWLNYIFEVIEIIGRKFNTEDSFLDSFFASFAPNIATKPNIKFCKLVVVNTKSVVAL